MDPARISQHSFTPASAQIPITRRGRVDPVPAYDLLNTAIALSKPQDETALPIRGKRSRLTRADLFKYFALESLQIDGRVLEAVVERFQAAFAIWDELLKVSFLSLEKKISYKQLLDERRSRLRL